MSRSRIGARRPVAQASALAFLVTGAWTEGEAQERGVTVSDREAREATTGRRTIGLTRQDLIYEARLSLLTAGIRAQIEQPAAQSVTPEQISTRTWTANPQTRARAAEGPRHPKPRHGTRPRRPQKPSGAGSTWRLAQRRYATEHRLDPQTVEPGDVRRTDVERRDLRSRHEPSRSAIANYVFRVTSDPPGAADADRSRAARRRPGRLLADQAAATGARRLRRARSRRNGVRGTSCAPAYTSESALWQRVQPASGQLRALTASPAPKTRTSAELRRRRVAPLNPGTLWSTADNLCTGARSPVRVDSRSCID